MALPTLVKFEDCASWAKTVDPYIPQLYELPSRVVDVLQGRQGLVSLYTATNPLISGFAISVVLGAVFLVVAEINKNYSQVDRCWSILPTFYIAHFDLWARLAGVSSQRIDVILAFGVAWSVSRGYVRYWACTSADPALLDSPDLQLLAQRRIHCRLRRLQMVRKVTMALCHVRHA